MGLKEILIAVAIFSLVTIVGVMTITDLDENYDEIDLTNTQSKFSAVYNLSKQLNSTSQEMKDDVFGGEIDEEATEDSLFKGAFKSIKQMADLFKMIDDIFNAIAVEIGIPRILVDFAVLILTIAIVFGIILLIFRIKG